MEEVSATIEIVNTNTAEVGSEVKDVANSTNNIYNYTNEMRDRAEQFELASSKYCLPEATKES